MLEGRIMTTAHYLVMDLEFTYAGEPGADTDEEFDLFTEQVLEALSDLERVDSGLSDPDTTAVISRRQLAITMLVDADTLPDALRIFSANVRTALHVAGCQTPGWPTFRPEGDGLPPARRADLADA
jgi:hypothetical protein